MKEKYVAGIKQFTNFYNAAGDKTEIRLATGEEYTFKYDENHRLEEATEPGGFKLTNEYSQATGNSNGMPTKYSEAINGVTQTTTFGYDGLRRLISVTGPKGGVSEFFYNEQGGVSQIKNGSTEVLQDYDAAGKLTRQMIMGSSNLDLKYSYYANGQVKSYAEGTKSNTYVYDFAGRLYSWNDGISTVNYRYDMAGNLENPHGLNLTFNGANEIIGFLYDDAGNLTKDNKYNYVWDQQGQLTSVKDLSGKVIASYTYHPDGLRKSKTVGATIYNYHYDGSNLVRVTNGSGATVCTITWADGKPVSMTNSSGTTYYYVTNYRGDVIRIMDGNGIAVASYSYDPWGKLISKSENSPVVGQPIRYASYVYDSETSLYYLQARYYDPETARFVSRDPYRGQLNPIGQNLYAYANDDPVNYVDSYGKIALAVPVAVGGYKAVAGLLLAIAAVTTVASIDNAIEMVTTNTNRTNATIIYRTGSGNATNLTPRQSDIAGLSYTTIRPSSGPYTVTTIEAINATGQLIAIRDYGNHVSVRPVNFYRMQEWINSRSTALQNPHEFTTLLQKISAKIK